MRTTNLDKIKEATKLLAKSVSVTSVPEFDMLSTHPFTESVIWYKKFSEAYLGSGKIEPNKIAKEIDLRVPETFSAWLEEFNAIVDKAKTVVEVYMLWRTPYKLLFVKMCQELLSDKELAEYLADAWVTEDNPNMDVNVSRREALELFKKCKKTYLMTPEDYQYYKNLPDQITVWRGVGVGRTKYGLSWTDDEEKAKWFMNRWNAAGEQGTMLRATVDKKDVVAYFNTRNEKEILLDVFACKNNIMEIK